MHRNEIDERWLRPLAIGLLVIGLTAGCGGSAPETEVVTPSHGLSQGMTRAEVVERLGEPLEDKALPEMDGMRLMEYDNRLLVYIENERVIAIVDEAAPDDEM